MRIVKTFWIFIGKRMVNDYWIVSVFETLCGFRIVEDFRIFIRKRMVNDYGIVCVFGIVILFGM